MPYFYLATAIASEIAATTALKACDGFTKPVPSLVVLIGYGLALLFLSLTLRTVPVGVAYAIWAGAGTAFMAVIGTCILKQSLDTAAIVGITLIIGGVVVLNAFSTSIEH
jgi:small multidrug resistance pump